MAFPQGPNRPGITAKQPSNGIKIPTEMIVEAIRKARGNLSRAADRLKVCRQTLYTRSLKEPEIKSVIEECRERILDDIENVAHEKALEGDTTMNIFMLKTIGKKRGYDMHADVIVESATRAALDFVFNKSKSPVQESI